MPAPRGAGILPACPTRIHESSRKHQACESHLPVKRVSYSDSLIAGGGQNARATMAAVFCMVTAKHSNRIPTFHHKRALQTTVAHREWRTQRFFVRHFLMGIAGFLIISAASVFSGASAVVKASSVILTSVFGIRIVTKPFERARRSNAPTRFRDESDRHQQIKVFRR